MDKNKQLNQTYYDLIREEYTGFSSRKISEIEKSMLDWAYSVLQLKNFREELAKNESKDN